MSAITSLQVGETDPPGWTRYEGDETDLFEANYLVPILWMALFDEEHLRMFRDMDGDPEDPEEPFLIRDRADCIEALENRRAFILNVSSGARVQDQLSSDCWRHWPKHLEST